MLSALIAAVALFAASGGNGNGEPPSTSEGVAPAISSMRVDDNGDRLVYRFEGTLGSARLRSTEAVYVVAQLADPEADEWIVSDPAEIDRDSLTWVAELRRPPLTRGSFKFSAVVATVQDSAEPSPAPATDGFFGTDEPDLAVDPEVAVEGSLEEDGPGSDYVVRAGESRQFEIE